MFRNTIERTQLQHDAVASPAAITGFVIRIVVQGVGPPTQVITAVPCRALKFGVGKRLPHPLRDAIDAIAARFCRNLNQILT